jgi:hypothetical protein
MGRDPETRVMEPADPPLVVPQVRPVRLEAFAVGVLLLQPGGPRVDDAVEHELHAVRLPLPAGSAPRGDELGDLVVPGRRKDEVVHQDS